MTQNSAHPVSSKASAHDLGIVLATATASRPRILGSAIKVTRIVAFSRNRDIASPCASVRELETVNAAQRTFHVIDEIVDGALDSLLFRRRIAVTTLGTEREADSVQRRNV